MSDSESGDGMDELQAILDEYASKETKQKGKSTKKSTTTKEPAEWIKSEEEVRLEKLIFGDKEGLLENLKKSSVLEDSDKDDKIEEPQSKKRKPAWEDSDDNIKIGELSEHSRNADKQLKKELETRYGRIFKTPKWADLDQKPDVDSEDEIFQTVGFVSKTKSVSLEPTILDFKRQQDLNRKKHFQGTVNSVQFHPTSTMAMVSCSSGITALFAVDGSKNKKFHSFRFEGFPIKCSRISICGTKAMFSAGKSYYYTYDLMQATEIKHYVGFKRQFEYFDISPDGKYFATVGLMGFIYLYDMKCKELLHTFKQEDRVADLRFSMDSTKIIATSTSSYVTIYDVRKERIMHSFLDDGCIHGMSLALSPNGKMLATGSAEGAVNIYDYEKVFLSKAPQPEKTLLNLTTYITNLNFNHSSEILGMCSSMVKSSVRMVHFPTGTVYSNFPGLSQDPLPLVKRISFSPSSGYLGLGLVESEVALFRLKHFKNY